MARGVSEAVEEHTKEALLSEEQAPTAQSRRKASPACSSKFTTGDVVTLVANLDPNSLDSWFCVGPKPVSATTPPKSRACEPWPLATPKTQGVWGLSGGWLRALPGLALRIKSIALRVLQLLLL